MSAIVIQCSRGWQPAHQGVIPGQVGHPFLIRRKLADRGRNAWVRTVMSDQSLAATVGLKGGLIPRGASAPGDRPVARHRCGYRVILRESPLFLTRIIFKVPRRPLILIIGPAGVSWRVLSRTSRFCCARCQSMINTPLSRDADAERAARSRGNLTSSGAGGNKPTRNVLCPSCRARTSTRDMKVKVGSGAHCPGLPTVDYSTTSPGGIPAPHQIYHGLACIRRGELGWVCSAVDLHAGVRVSVSVLVRGW